MKSDPGSKKNTLEARFFLQMRFTMAQEMRQAVQPKIPATKKKSQGSTGAIQKQRKVTLSMPEGEDTLPETRFPIVGIGASAGGLEALELFLANVPKDCGMAFVIVQHLDPTYKGMLVELLQRGTRMQVLQVKDQMRVEADCVYVIPPNKDLSILHGVLHLHPPLAPRGLRLPIDFFFRALAQDQQEHSIGVILSGMGMDGTLGLRAIKETGGSVFVQSPDTAKFDGMPHSAIDAGLADVISAAENLPTNICAYIHHAPLFARPNMLDEDQAKSSIEKVMLLLRAQTGHDFSLYKKTTIYRRIERRIGLHHLDNIAAYVRFLRENPGEVELLFNELLIGVTHFFRDPEMWERLKSEALPDLLAERSPEQTLRAWVPGCSSGEEAYSLAMLFKEALDAKPHRSYRNFNLQIFASDLDAHAIEQARAGVYPASIAANVSPERLNRFFVKEERGYQVAKAIREMVIFAPQNLIMDPPFTKLDILSCRNLLIYLTPELQKKILPLFHYSLNPGGILFLGNSETIGGFTDLFAPVDNKARLYRRLASTLSTRSVEFPTTFSASRPGASAKLLKQTVNIQALADSLILQTYAPAAVLTNKNGDILYVSGRTGKYLEAAAGKANWNLFAMAREGLRYELTGVFQKALRQKETVTLKDILVGTDSGTQRINVTIQPIRDDKELGGMVMVIFSDMAAPSIKKLGGKVGRGSAANDLTELKQQLDQARLEVQSIREQMQTSQEELKSTNEELQSTNEELQSTNEELTTSKEEMQSMNEELQTVNNELQTKLDEISNVNSDMKNLLDSTDIATLFLDNNLHVRRFTSQTSKITSLIPGDVGRPITDIASALLYPQLAEDAREVLRTLVKVDRQIPLPGGDWFGTRILPYRTLDNMIDGVVITFIDITEIKKLEGREKLMAELVIANQDLAFQNEEKEKRAAELVLANQELAFQNEEKEKRAAELVLANQELAFQNEEKEKRAAELVLANAYLEKLTAEMKK
jgi:chemotaxis methyl-accepting protein methylase/chemotaxis response regulator CheB